MANRARQRELYGAPLGDRVRRLTTRLGISQARLARVLGISPAMLSQLVSARRVKIGDPAVLARLRALDRRSAGSITPSDRQAVDGLLAEVAPHGVELDGRSGRRRTGRARCRAPAHAGGSPAPGGRARQAGGRGGRAGHGVPGSGRAAAAGRAGRRPRTRGLSGAAVHGAVAAAPRSRPWWPRVRRQGDALPPLHRVPLTASNDGPVAATSQCDHRRPACRQVRKACPVWVSISSPAETVPGPAVVAHLDASDQRSPEAPMSRRTPTVVLAGLAALAVVGLSACGAVDGSAHSVAPAASTATTTTAPATPSATPVGDRRPAPRARRGGPRRGPNGRCPPRPGTGRHRRRHRAGGPTPAAPATGGGLRWRVSRPHRLRRSRVHGVDAQLLSRADVTVSWKVIGVQAARPSRSTTPTPTAPTAATTRPAAR